MHTQYNKSTSMYNMWLCVIKKQNNQTVKTQSKIVEKDNSCIHIYTTTRSFCLVHTLQRKVASVNWFYESKYRYNAHVYQ